MDDNEYKEYYEKNNGYNIFSEEIHDYICSYMSEEKNKNNYDCFDYYIKILFRDNIICKPCRCHMIADVKKKLKNKVMEDKKRIEQEEEKEKIKQQKKLFIDNSINVLEQQIKELINNRKYL